MISPVAGHTARSQISSLAQRPIRGSVNVTVSVLVEQVIRSKMARAFVMSAVMGSEPLVFSTVLPPLKRPVRSFLTRAYEHLYPALRRHQGRPRSASACIGPWTRHRANIINPRSIDTGRMTPVGSLSSRPDVSEHRTTPPTSSGSCSPSKASGSTELLYSNGGYPSDHRHPARSRTAHRDSTK